MKEARAAKSRAAYLNCIVRCGAGWLDEMRMRKQK